LLRQSKIDGSLPIFLETEEFPNRRNSPLHKRARQWSIVIIEWIMSARPCVRNVVKDFNGAFALVAAPGVK
jgi:hypothetical protein